MGLRMTRAHRMTPRYSRIVILLSIVILRTMVTLNAIVILSAAEGSLHFRFLHKAPLYEGSYPTPHSRPIIILLSIVILRTMVTLNAIVILSAAEGSLHFRFLHNAPLYEGSYPTPHATFKIT